MMLTLHIRLFLFLTSGFFLFTIAGTLSHEAGHYFVGKLLGGDPSIHYGYTSGQHHNMEVYRTLDSLYTLYREDIGADRPFPAKQLYEEVWRRYRNESLWIFAGGPIQTMLTGTLGLICLLLFRRNNQVPLTTNAWICVFLALFWLRPLVNTLVGMGQLLITGTRGHSDEINIARLLNLNPYIIEIITAAIGFLILVYIVFRVIPHRQRITFLLSGIVGGATGYLFWLVYAGPVLMP